MFSLIKVGDTAVVAGKVYEVVRTSSSRFWLEIDGQPVKFTRKNGIEYGAGRDRIAQPVDEAPAPERRKQARRAAIGDLPEPQFNWLIEVDACLGPDRSVMDAIKRGWDWEPAFTSFPEAPYIGALAAATFVL